MEHEVHSPTPVEDVEAELKQLRDEIARLKVAGSAAAGAADARSRFLAHVSHELRTPMNSILGMTRLALATELTDEQREYLDVVYEATDNLLTLVNDLLDQAKIDAGVLELDRIPFRIDDLIGGILRSVKLMADHKGLDMDYVRHPDVPERLIGDPTRLRQVLLNLAMNATKFTEEGGVVLSVEPTGDGGPNRVRFSVADSGVGIPAEQLARIFDVVEPQPSDHSHHSGAGLGLSVSHRLVEFMGGELRARSQVDVGSTFEFDIPLPVAPEPSVPAADMGGGITSVLWLTDHAEPRGDTMQALAARGMPPTVVEKVEEVEEEMRSGRRPAIVVVDLQQGALDAAWEVRREMSEIPMMVITPGGQRGDAARCREVGVSGYLTGPLVAGDIVDAIEAVVAGVPELVTRHWLNERRRSLSLLVADDSPTNRTLLARMLEKRGHRAVQARTGQEVLDAIEADHFDLVLLDLHMPELDGYETATRLRSLPGPVGSVPIIAVSGSVNDDGRARCREIGINDFVGKPFHAEQLLELVERLAV